MIMMYCVCVCLCKRTVGVSMGSHLYASASPEEGITKVKL